jgi:DNA-binding LacI/PurR family transcriptional regulator
MVSVVGYDDAGLSRLAHVNLTTVSQDARARPSTPWPRPSTASTTAAAARSETVLAPHLIVRGSTGPHRPRPEGQQTAGG